MLPSTAPRSRTLRSFASSWSSRAASSAWMVGGTTTSCAPESPTIASISSTKSGLPPAASRIRAWRPASRRPRRQLPDQRVRLVRVQRLEQHRRGVAASHRPTSADGRGARAGPCTGAGSARRGSSRRRGRRGRAASARPSAGRRGRRRRAPHARAACGRPRRSPPRQPARPTRRAATARAAAARGSDGRRAELQHRLDHGPVGDPLAVGEAAAASPRARPSSPETELGREPRLADAGRAEDREEVAGALASRPAPRPRRARAARARGRRSGRRGAARSAHRRRRLRAGRPSASRSCPSARGCAPRRSRPRRARGPASPRRSAPAPARPPARGGPRR